MKATKIRLLRTLPRYPAADGLVLGEEFKVLEQQHVGDSGKLRYMVLTRRGIRCAIYWYDCEVIEYVETT